MPWPSNKKKNSQESVALLAKHGTFSPSKNKSKAGQAVEYRSEVISAENFVRKEKQAHDDYQAALETPDLSKARKIADCMIKACDYIRTLSDSPPFIRGKATQESKKWTEAFSRAHEIEEEVKKDSCCNIM